MQKRLGKSRFDELLTAYIEKPQGKPTLVPESDKRPAMNNAKTDFMVFCMATTNLNIRTDKAIKDQAEEIFNELGLNMTTAVNMFLRTAIREHGIPFELKLEVPNDTTTTAIEEGRKMMKDPSAPRYSSMDALKAALDV